MLYYKNIELAEKYHVSLGTVRNWIESAKSGKLDLSMHKVNDRFFIENTPSNLRIIEQIVESRKKFRPGSTVKKLTPKKKFYEIYSQSQVYDIVTSLEVGRSISRKYSYFEDGADSWDEYVKKLDQQVTPSNLNMTKELLEANEKYIDNLMRGYEKVNIVDLGAGNAYPAKDLIQHLLDQNKLGRYIAVDISPRMLEIAKQNVENWFDGKVEFQKLEIDFTKDSFSDLLASDYISSSDNNIGSLMLLFGGTIQNFNNRNKPLQVIAGSMGVNDYLMVEQKLDSDTTRNHFYFGDAAKLPDTHKLVIDLLNIDKSMYDVEQGYDEHKRQRFEQIRLKSSIEITFNFTEGERVISINRGEAIMVWMATQDTSFDLIDLLDKNDLYVLHSSQSEDQEYILTISKVKHN